MIRLIRIIRRILSNPRILIHKAKHILVNTFIIAPRARKKGFTFIQVGANDGVYNDPIHRFVMRYNWKGVLVEPHRGVFEKLIENYAGREDLVFENAAVDGVDGEVDFYECGDPALSSLQPDEWFVGRNRGEAHANRLNAGGSRPVKVRAMTLNTLAEKHGLHDIDLLQIDTEGRDIDIITSLDFSRLRPAMIRYEDHHHSRKTVRQCIEFLRNKGYKVVKCGSDTVAWWPYKT